MYVFICTYEIWDINVAAAKSMVYMLMLQLQLFGQVSCFCYYYYYFSRVEDSFLYRYSPGGELHNNNNLFPHEKT